MTNKTDSILRFNDWIHTLSFQAENHPERLAYRFLADGERESATLNYGTLYLRARAIAARLVDSVSPGDRVLLLFPEGLEFVETFFGCLFANVIAVPVAFPRKARDLEVIAAIIRDADLDVILTTTEMHQKLAHASQLLAKDRPVHWLFTEETENTWSEAWQKPRINLETIAFLQYTSGSTGTPKGVRNSHRNLLHNVAWQSQMIDDPEADFVSWLPLFHDMGLIGKMMQSAFRGSACTLMTPLAFVQKPLRWLQAMTDYKAGISYAPNFAYELCVDKIKPEQRAELDLSRWRTALNGAEPVRAETLERFAKAFAPCGFSQHTFAPAFGLAEGTLVVAFTKEPPKVLHVDAEELGRHQATTVLEDAPGSRCLAASGKPLGDLAVKIVDPATGVIKDDRQVGEIWVNGTSVSMGYWQKPDLSRATFQAQPKDAAGKKDTRHFLRTGDLGFMADGWLYVTGRIKDLIIVHGQNHYPQDIEHTLWTCHQAMRSGGCAVFTLTEDGEDLHRRPGQRGGQRSPPDPT